MHSLAQPCASCHSPGRSDGTNTVTVSLSLVEILPSSIDRPEATLGNLHTPRRSTLTTILQGCSNKCQVTNQEPGGLEKSEEVAPGH